MTPVKKALVNAISRTKHIMPCDGPSHSPVTNRARRHTVRYGQPEYLVATSPEKCATLSCAQLLPAGNASVA